MDDEDDANYPGVNQESSIIEYAGNDGHDDYEEDIDNEEDDDDDDDDDGGNGVQRIHKDDFGDGDEDDDQDDENGNLKTHPKKRKLKTLLSSYEFAPRLPAPSSVQRHSYGGRNPLTDWTEHETFVLLDAWGGRFLRQGKKSLRSEEWQEVADKVSQESTIERTDTQCRNRLDTLKKKYKKEKARLGSGGSLSTWVYFKKLDTLLSSSPTQQSGLSCGVDSGEYVFMNPKAYLGQSNRLDEMRDSPGNSENDSEGLPPQRTKTGGVKGSSACIKLVADSIKKFSKIYEKTENNKRRDMLELEKLRMEFRKDLELQRNRILERAQAEIAKIRQGGGDEDNDISADD